MFLHTFLRQSKESNQSETTEIDPAARAQLQFDETWTQGPFFSDENLNAFHVTICAC